MLDNLAPGEAPAEVGLIGLSLDTRLAPTTKGARLAADHTPMSLFCNRKAESEGVPFAPTRRGLGVGALRDDTRGGSVGF